MKEPTLLERLVMMMRTIASIVVWVVAIVIKILRGLLPGGSDEPKVAAHSPSNNDTPPTN